VEQTLFYVTGCALVLAALALTAVGLRWPERFPSRLVLMVGTIALGGLVAATMAFAVISAGEEQDKRDAELAEEEAAAADEVAAEPAGAPAGQPPAEGAAVAETLDVTSPADGGLVFEPADLAGKAGAITLAYANPSPVPHSIAVEDDGQANVLAESEVITDSEVEITAEFVPGEFIYFCTVPGHREAGMEGVLTVQ
jgi:plastocyanin